MPSVRVRRILEKLIAKKPDLAANLATRAYSSRELLKVGDRSFRESLRNPLSRFDTEELSRRGVLKALLASVGVLAVGAPLAQILGAGVSDQGRSYITRYTGVLPPSYIVFLHGGRAYAKCCLPEKAGLVEFQGTEHTEVIQNAINNIMAGIVFLKAGTYNINSTISMKTNVSMIGEGRVATTLKGALGLDPVILCDNLGTVEIADLRISNASCAIRVRNAAWHVYIKNVNLRDLTDYGIVFEGTAGSENSIEDVYLYCPDLAGVGLGIYSHDAFINKVYGCVVGTLIDIGTINSFFSNLQIYGCDVGMRIAMFKYSKMVNVNIAACNTGILLDPNYHGYGSITNLTLYDNKVYHINANGTSTAWAGPMTFSNVWFIYENHRPDYAIRIKYPRGRWAFRTVQMEGVPYAVDMFETPIPVGSGAGFYIEFEHEMNHFTQSVSAGSSSVNVTLPVPMPLDHYNILITPSWETSWTVTNITRTGFTVKFGTAPASDTYIRVKVW